MSDDTKPRSIEEKIPEVVDPRDWGAKGDGVADDTEAIQAALNWARQLDRPFRLEAGVYRTTGTVWAGPRSRG